MTATNSFLFNENDVFNNMFNSTTSSYSEPPLTPSPPTSPTNHQLDGVDFFGESNDASLNRWSSVGSEKISSVKRRGGGSWVLGFTRMQNGGETNSDLAGPPLLVRSNSFESIESCDSSDSGDSIFTSSSSSTSSKKGVSFNESVLVKEIPHASSYSSKQRKMMYSSSREVRENKRRNKKEYRYDGCDWRNATEEWDMKVCMVTGELIHPVHDEFVYPIYR